MPVTFIVPIKEKNMPLTVMFNYMVGDGDLMIFGSSEHETPNRKKCEIKRKGRPAKVACYQKRPKGATAPYYEGDVFTEPYFYVTLVSVHDYLKLEVKCNTHACG